MCTSQQVEVNPPLSRYIFKWIGGASIPRETVRSEFRQSIIGSKWIRVCVACRLWILGMIRKNFIKKTAGMADSFFLFLRLFFTVLDGYLKITCINKAWITMATGDVDLAVVIATDAAVIWRLIYTSWVCGNISKIDFQVYKLFCKRKGFVWSWVGCIIPIKLVNEIQ